MPDINTKQIKINNQTLVTNNYEEGNGNLLSVTYGNNDQIKYEYDEFDRIHKVIKQDDTYKYQYDNNGNVSKILSNRGITRFDYDIAKRLEQYKNNDFVIRYGYDYGDNVVKRTYQLKNQTKVIENTLNEDDAVTKTSFEENKVIYEYDDLGRLVKRTINNQIPIEYTYVTNGKRTSTILKTQKIGEDLYNYHYDSLNNITRIYKNNNLEHRYYYDDYNELIKEKDYNTNETITYAYDESGNILSKKVYDLSTNTLKKQNTYEYSNLNWEDQLTKFNNESITYDEIGNPLTIGNKTLTWENGRQLKKIEDSNNTIEYQYNDGIRTSKTINNQKTDYYLEGNKIILEKREEDMIYYIRNEVDDLIGFEYQNQIYYYVKNIQNDIIGILDQNGNKVVTYTYDSWGNILSVKDSNNNDVSEDLTHIANINPFRYRSYYYDVETKLYYLNSRYYNPLWGRFLNVDEILCSTENLLSTNMYLYSFNNPISLEDDDGEWPKIGKWFKKNIKKIAIAAAVLTVGVIATVATGGGAAAVGIGAAIKSTLIGSAKIIATSVAASVAVKVVSNVTQAVISDGDDQERLNKVGEAIVSGIADGTVDGIVAGCMISGSMMIGQSLLYNAHYGLSFSNGETQALYATESTNGGTIVATKNKQFKKFRLDLDAVNGFHFHIGLGNKNKKHHIIIPWTFWKKS